MMQGVHEPVATFKRWQEIGRQVRKGSKAKMVLAPIMVSRTEDDKNGQTVKRQILVGFRDSRTVFSLSDTDGDDLPPVTLPGWDADTALAALGIDRVPFDMIDGNVQGYAYQDDKGKHLALNPIAAHPAKTTFHEMAHLTLGHCKQDDVTHRGIEEFEAEATAYLLAKELELIEWDAAESRAYIAGWLGRKETTDYNASRISQPSTRFLRPDAPHRPPSRPPHNPTEHHQGPRTPRGPCPIVNT